MKFKRTGEDNMPSITMLFKPTCKKSLIEIIHMYCNMNHKKNQTWTPDNYQTQAQ